MNSNSEIQGYNVYPILHFHRKFSSGVTPRASRVLTESRLGNLFSHFGLQGCTVLSRAEGKRGGVSIGSRISVLTFSTSNTVNLLTSSDRGALFAGHAKQNPPPGLNKPLLCKGHAW